jgi:excisionase family DNA binding protein
LTTTEAAVILGVEPGTVRKLIGEGLLPTIDRIGPMYLLDPAAVDELKARRQQGPRRRTGGPSIPAVAIEVLHLLAQTEALTAAELAGLVDRHEGNVRKYLKIWREPGYVAAHPTEPKSYYVTPEGHAYLANLTAKAS